MRIERISATVLVVALFGCGAGPTLPPLGVVVLTLEYQGTSDERPIEEAKLHATRDDFASAPNLLFAPLHLGESVTFYDVDPGEYYLTVVRLELPPPIVDRIALTTAESFTLSEGHVVIWIFDESFRIFDPVPIDNPNLDATIDSTVDSMVDSRVDSRVDAGPEGGVDAGPDAADDVTPAADAAVEAGVETGAEGPPADAGGDRLAPG